MAGCLCLGFVYDCADIICRLVFCLGVSFGLRGRWIGGLEFECLLIDIMVLSFGCQFKIEGWRFAGDGCTTLNSGWGSAAWFACRYVLCVGRLFGIF